jgi:hypothetical protein
MILKSMKRIVGFAHLLSVVCLLQVPPKCTAAEDLKSIGGDSIERELERFSESLAAQLRKAGVKKITILDLADNEKKSVPIGAFIAEETTVNLVSSTNTFIVVDRANLNKILEEHKLSRTGLEEPENVKKLGHFSGVDAIVTGTITPLKDEIRFTAKVISTETADILGAAKGRFPKSAELAQMLEVKLPVIKTNELQPVKPPEVTIKPTNAPPPKPPIPDNSQKIDDLLLQIESMKLVGDQYNANLVTTAVFKNTSSTKTLGIGMFSRSNREMESVVRNDMGDEFALFASSMSGLPWASSEQYLTEIKPGGTLVATLKYYISWKDKNGNFGPYRLQATILAGDGDRGRYTNVKQLNFNITIPTAR